MPPQHYYISLFCNNRSRAQCPIIIDRKDGFLGISIHLERQSNQFAFTMMTRNNYRTIVYNSYFHSTVNDTVDNCSVLPFVFCSFDGRTHNRCLTHDRFVYFIVTGVYCDGRNRNRNVWTRYSTPRKKQKKTKTKLEKEKNHKQPAQSSVVCSVRSGSKLTPFFFSTIEILLCASKHKTQQRRRVIPKRCLKCYSRIVTAARSRNHRS